MQPADDAGEVPALLEQVEGGIASVTADGAYDGDPVYQVGREKGPAATGSLRLSGLPKYPSLRA
jgi:hypothetical protein